uniref:Uncharacterized protein n=1 Tax=Arundo donax TaxID=35708 RepID=A0A0A9DMZ7_ARUDO
MSPPENFSSEGTGRKEPHSASSKFPSSEEIGSCTVISFVPSTNVPST